MRRAIVVILCVLVLGVGLLSCVSYEEFTYARSGNVESANDVTSIEVAKPGNTVEGDLLIGVVITDGDTSGNFTAPTSWTLIDVGWSGSDGYGGGCTLGAWYLIAGDSEPGSYQWTWTTEETVYAFIIRITGHDVNNPIDVWDFDTGVEGVSPTCPNVNTTVAESLVLRIFGYDSCYGWNAKYPNKHIGITAESSRPGCESGAVGHCSGGAAYTAQETAGDTGTAVFRVNHGGGLFAWRTLTIAVRPAPEPVVTTLVLLPETDSNPVDTTHNLTATVKDQFGYEMGGVAVTWTIESGPGNLVSHDATTDGNGEADAVITSSEPGTSTVKCEVAGTPTVYDTATKEWTYTPEATTLELLPETDSSPLDTTHDLTATVKDQFNNVMAGVDVTWGISGVGSFSGTLESQTDVNGEADAVITSSEPGTSTVTCEVTGKPSVSDTATKGWTYYTPEATTLELLPAIGSNPVGTTHNLIATVKDQFGYEMGGVDVTWSITGVGTFSGNSESSTDVNGEADAVITSSEPGTSMVKCEVTSKASVFDTATKGWTSVAVYDLTMAVNPDVGGMATDLSNESPYAEGAEVSIKAEANESYEFVSWTATEGVFGNATAAATTFTMPAQNVTVTANFEGVPPPPEAPTVIAQTATTITTKSTKLNMDYTTGDFSPVEVRFAYKKSTDSDWSYTDWVSKSADGTYTTQLTELSSNTEYDFKAELKYASSVIESVIIQFITRTLSLPPSQGCFIATAAYGTPTAEEIDVLREFRDMVLLESTVGSQFVVLYYQFSPPVADFIAGNEHLRALVREFLVDPIVLIVEATEGIWQN